MSYVPMRPHPAPRQYDVGDKVSVLVRAGDGKKRFVKQTVADCKKRNGIWYYQLFGTDEQRSENELTFIGSRFVRRTTQKTEKRFRKNTQPAPKRVAKTRKSKRLSGRLEAERPEAERLDAARKRLPPPEETESPEYTSTLGDEDLSSDEQVTLPKGTSNSEDVTLFDDIGDYEESSPSDRNPYTGWIGILTNTPCQSEDRVRATADTGSKYNFVSMNTLRRFHLEDEIRALPRPCAFAGINGVVMENRVIHITVMASNESYSRRIRCFVRDNPPFDLILGTNFIQLNGFAFVNPALPLQAIDFTKGKASEHDATCKV